MELTPRQIVHELDRYIVGQEEAKKAVAIALRNRYRRSRVSEGLREEISPKNILMIGPTGVGKTEIARRLAKLVNAPFIKVEATKFTEVGYVGRDVESMIRDLVEVAVRMVKDNKKKEVEAIKDISLKIKEGEFIAIVGPSGCGKSTLLNIIGNLDNKTEGKINYPLESNNKLGYMFQQDCLFDHLTILDNCLLGLKIQNNLTISSLQ